MGGTFCSRVGLLKWSLSPHKSEWRDAHDADQWQIPEKVLSIIKLTHTSDQINTLADRPYYSLGSKIFGRALKKSMPPQRTAILLNIEPNKSGKP